MAILDVDSYPEIRALLDVTLEEERLPDHIIGLPAYVGEAERRVIERLPDWATQTGDAAERVRMAAVLLTAAVLAPAMPVITREDRLAYSYSRERVDWAARAAQLTSQAEAQLDLVSPPSTPEVDRHVRVLFDVAHSRRGGF